MSELEAKHFAFAVCGANENAWLKREVAREHSGWRFAFSRPGLVTWRVPAEQAELSVSSPVARVSGVSLGKLSDASALRAGLGAVAGRVRAVNVFYFGETLPDEQAAASGATQVKFWQDSAATCLGPLSAQPAVGETVCDIMIERGSEGAWLGHHRQLAHLPNIGGGLYACEPPAYAPSRAYAKVVELLQLAEFEPNTKWRAVELGAAPGGGTLALLERGVAVTAVDPAPLASDVLERARQLGVHCDWVQKPAGELVLSDLPRQPELLLTDVNLAPSVSLNYIERVAKLVQGPKLGILMTLKINDSKVEAALPALLVRAQSLGVRFGLDELRAMHLPSQRREVGVVLRRRRKASLAKGSVGD